MEPIAQRSADMRWASEALDEGTPPEEVGGRAVTMFILTDDPEP